MTTDTGPMRPGWQRWLSTPVAGRTAIGVAIAAGAGLVGAGAVATSALIRDRPIPGLGLLLIPAIVVLGVGQVWMLAQVQLRQAGRRPVSGQSVEQPGSVQQTGSAGALTRTLKGPISFFFGDLQPAAAYVLLVCFYLGWLIAFTAFSSLGSGGPGGARPECAFTLDDHGSINCVTKAVFQHAGASEQRFATGVLFSFFSLHLGAALGSKDRFRGPRRHPRRT